METQSLPNTQNFRLWLQKEFTDRSRRNPRFSLRAFAKLLKMEASSVSQILAGKRRPSAKVVEKICDQLSVPPTIRAELLRSLPGKKNEVSEVFQPNYIQLSADAFSVMADWYHYAILELPFAENFQSSPKWIAKKLGISATEAALAVERLERLELLEKKTGRLVRTEALLTNYSEGQSNSAMKELQRQVLQKALDAIDHVVQEEKDITSMTMAIDPAKLPEAKQRIRQFRRDLCAFLEDGPRTRIYNLGLQLYPISKITTGEEN